MDFVRIETCYQHIIDNLLLLDDAALLKINDIVVSFAHSQVFKKNGSIVCKNR